MNLGKKVLIISYYWPPAGGISVHRCLKFAKYLSQYGWEPIIYTAKDAQYPYLDESNFRDIPEGITVLRQPIVEPFNLFKKLSGRKKEDALNNIVHVRSKKRQWIDEMAIWIRGNFFIPDARSLWIRPSVRFLLNYLEKNSVNAILSDGPPHTNTAIATQLKLKTGIPFLADFQDPWTQADYYPLMKLSSWADKKHKKMEQKVFHCADKITIASKQWKQDLEKIGAHNVDVIYWGFDEDDFKDIKVVPDAHFTITHAGLMGYDRLPDTFFAVLFELCQQDKEFDHKLKLQFPGQVDYAVMENLEAYGLSNKLAVKGTLGRPEVLKMLCSSQLLLLLLNKANNVSGRVPGKFFEYLRARCPILCLGSNKGDVADIIAETQSGIAIHYEDKEALKEFIYQQFNAFKANTSRTTQGNISPYAVSEQVRKLASYLEEIVKVNL